MLALGAVGAWVGTRFLGARESSIHDEYRQRLLEASEGDTYYATSLFDGGWPDAPHRVLLSSVEALESGEEDVVAVRDEGGREIPVERGSSEPPSRNMRGEIAAMALYAGESVGSVERVQPAAEIVRELVDEAEALLARGPA